MSSFVKAEAAAEVDLPPQAEPDPYAALDDLMCVIEALCPIWPPRPIFGPAADMKL